MRWSRDRRACAAMQPPDAARPAVAIALHDVSPADPATFAAVAALLTIVAGVASAVPAWRASRVDPILALKSE